MGISTCYEIMDTEFKQTFVRLGLEQYLPIFVRSGFSDWHLLCNITESDFGVLGVKRGHRRKIQREIARRHLWPDKDPLPSGGIVSSIGIEGNERADKAAKEATGLAKNPRPGAVKGS